MKGKRFLYIFAFCFVLLLGAPFLKSSLLDRYLAVKKLDARGNFRFLSFNDLMTVVNENALGKNILEVRTDKLESLVKENFLYVQEVEVEKVYPNQLLLFITERKPIALIKKPSDERFFMVDEVSVILGEADPNAEPLPIVNYEGLKDIKVGSKLDDPGVLFLLKTVREFSSVESLPRSLILRNSWGEALLPDGVLVLFSTAKSPEITASLLKQSLLKYRLNNIMLKKVDLRYDNVVVE